ncbi:hypothetical protein ACFL51_01940 [Myxococcota bacterium]
MVALECRDGYVDPIALQKALVARRNAALHCVDAPPSHPAVNQPETPTQAMDRDLQLLIDFLNRRGDARTHWPDECEAALARLKKRYTVDELASLTARDKSTISRHGKKG